MNKFLRILMMLFAFTWWGTPLAFAWDNPPACQYGVGQCKLGYVWRDANDKDHVCVPGSSRDRVAQENAEAPSRKEPSSDNCKFGWVWREANKEDHACVTGHSRSTAAAERRVAVSRIDAKCTVGAVCTFNCNAEQQACQDVHDGRDCKRVRAQCMRRCSVELGATTPTHTPSCVPTTTCKQDPVTTDPRCKICRRDNCDGTASVTHTC